MLFILNNILSMLKNIARDPYAGKYEFKHFEAFHIFSHTSKHFITEKAYLAMYMIIC